MAMKKMDKSEKKEDVILPTPPEQEMIAAEDLAMIMSAKGAAVNATLVAEKAVALAKQAEATAENVILKVCMKYHVDLGKDSIQENGLIVRGGDK